MTWWLGRRLGRFLPWNRHTAADARFFVDRDIRDWRRVVLHGSNDAILEVGKGYGDGAEQELQVTVRSGGYTRFVYANQQDWLSGEFRLPRFARLRNNRDRSLVAIVVYRVAFDEAALTRDLPGFLCKSNPYRFPDKLLPMPANYLGPERFQGFLRVLAENLHDPEWMLAAFKPGRFMAQNFGADDSLYHAIYQALRTGRDPAAVVACLSDFDISDTREDIVSFVKRAHQRMHAY
jgi:hypothetical protein